ncbi:MAG: GNAT family N-acetyltransferase [Pseudomonadota bacterium]
MDSPDLTHDIVVDDARQDDLPGLQSLREVAFRPIFAALRAQVGSDVAAIAYAKAEDQQARHLAQIAAAGDGVFLLVARRSGRIAGFCAAGLDAETKIGEIGLNAVAPEHQGFGVAQALYQAAFLRLRQGGMKAVAVATGADESHAPARRAYRQAGFASEVPGVYFYRRL